MTPIPSPETELRRDRLLDELARSRPPLTELGPLLDDDDPVVRHAALRALRDHLLDGTPDSGARVPDDPRGMPPESVALLAELHLSDPPGAPTPLDAPVPDAVEPLWIAAVVSRLGRLPDRPPALLCAAVAHVRWDALRDPRPALKASLDHPATARAATRALSTLGRAGRASLAALGPLLAAQIEGPHADLAAAALAEPWALGWPVPPEALLPRLDGLAAPAAARALVARGHVDGALRALADETRPPTAHDALLVALGDAEIPAHPLVERALADPPRFARPALEALLRLRRRGVRIEPAHVGPVVALGLAAPDLPPGRVAEVLDPHPADAAAALRAAVADAASPTRAVAILAELPRDVADGPLAELAGTPRGLHLIDQLAPLLARRFDDPGCAAALARLLAHDPALTAGLDLPPSAVSARLPRLRHRATLRAGGAFGWAKAVAAGEVDEAVLFALQSLEPAAEADLSRWATTAGHPLRSAAIAALGRTGSTAVQPALAEGLADEDEAIVDATVAALTALGHRCPPSPTARCGSPDPRVAALVVAIGHALADDPPPRVRAALLTRLAGMQHRGLAHHIRPDLRHRDVDVRAAALRALGAAVEPAATAWLLSRAVPDDIREARALFEALGRRADPAGCAALLAGLEQRNMNLKKTAAEALARSGDTTAVPALLFWLGRHDNPGFREALSAALDAIVGDAALGVLRMACDAACAAGQGERVERLCLAFDGRVGADGLARWIDRAPWGPALARLVLDRRVHARGDAVTAVRRRIDLERAAPTAVEAGHAAWSARQTVLGWAAGTDPGNALAALGALRPLRTPSAALFDRACALLPHADAHQQATLLGLLIDGARLDGGRRFRAVHTLRRFTADDLLDAAASVMRRLGGWPDAHERPRWQRHPEGTVRARAALPLHDPAEPIASRRRALIVAGDGALALFEALDGRDHPTLVLETLEATAGPQAALDAILSTAGEGRWAPLLAALLDRPQLARAVLDARQPPLSEAAARLIQRHPSALGLALLERGLGEKHRAATDVLAARGRTDALAACIRRGRLPKASGDAIAAVIRATPLGDDRLARLAQHRRAEHAITARLVRRVADDPAQAPPALLVELRARPFEAVWPHVARRFTPAWLSALAATATPPGALISALATAEGAARVALVRWFAGAARLGPLHAPGLRATLLADPAALDREGWRLLCAAIDGPEARAALIDGLRAHTAPDEAAGIVLDGLEGLPPEAQIPLLLPWSTAPAARDRLAELWAHGERARRQLPAELLPAVLERCVAGLTDRLPAGPRRILTALAEADPPGIALIDLLAAALDHPDTTVQAHAHRLLRRHAPRARYLAETRRLLVDRHPSVMRRAVRVLCYGDDTTAVKRIVGHLHSADRALREAARDGLIHLGEPALDALYKARGAARPDRRASIEQVIASIEAGDVLAEA